MKAVYFVVPLMLFGSSILMAFAWLGHIRLRRVRYHYALLASWVLVLPEYLLNVGAMRWGSDVYAGGTMAAMNLSASVVCMALVARYFLGEKLEKRQIVGVVLMTMGVFLLKIP